MPDKQRLSPTGIFYFQKPERREQQAGTNTLIQLSLAFGWAMPWLRAVNREASIPDDAATVLSPASQRATAIVARHPQLGPILDRLAELNADGQRSAAVFISSLVTQAAAALKPVSAAR